MPAPRSKPRVLFLTGHVPYPGVSGGRLREYELIRRLRDGYEVEVCAVSKTFVDDRRTLARLRDLPAEVRLFRAEPPGAPPVQAAHVRRHRSAEAASYVATAIREVDLVHVEGFYLLQHVSAAMATPVVLAEQNVEFALWRQRSEAAADEVRRRAHFREYRLTRQAEIAAWRRATACVAVTEEDRATMHRSVRGLDVRVVPDGADHLQPAASRRRLPEALGREAPTLVYVGNFAYEPNLDAALHLCRDVFPRVARRVPDARLFLVGNGPPRVLHAIADSDERITVTGRVRSLAPYLERADVFVCPLRIGGGVKVKMLEALTHGKAIVATPVAAQGLASAVDAVAVERDPAPFARRVVRLLEHPAERGALEAAARAAAARLPTWDDAAASLAACYDAALAASYAALNRATSSSSRNS